MACQYDPAPCPNCGEPRYPMIDHICHTMQQTEDLGEKVAREYEELIRIFAPGETTCD